MTAVEQVRGWFAEHRHEQARASVIARSLGAEMETVVTAMSELLRGGELIGAHVTRGDGTRDIDARLALSRSGPPPTPAFNGPVAPGRLIVPRPTTVAPLAPGAYTVTIPAAAAAPPPAESVPKRRALPTKQRQMLGRVEVSTGHTTAQLAAMQGVSEAGGYYLLRELEKAGMVVSFKPNGGRCKELWTVTDVGQRQLQAAPVEVQPPAATAPTEPQPAASPAPRLPRLSVDEAVQDLADEWRRSDDTPPQDQAAHQDDAQPNRPVGSDSLRAELSEDGAVRLTRFGRLIVVEPEQVPLLYRIACAARVLTEGM